MDDTGQDEPPRGFNALIAPSPPDDNNNKKGKPMKEEENFCKTGRNDLQKKSVTIFEATEKEEEEDDDDDVEATLNKFFNFDFENLNIEGHYDESPLAPRPSLKSVYKMKDSAELSTASFQDTSANFNKVLTTDLSQSDLEFEDLKRRKSHSSKKRLPKDEKSKSKRRKNVSHRNRRSSGTSGHKHHRKRVSGSHKSKNYYQNRQSSNEYVSTKAKVKYYYYLFKKKLHYVAKDEQGPVTRLVKNASILKENYFTTRRFHNFAYDEHLEFSMNSGRSLAFFPKTPQFDEVAGQDYYDSKKILDTKKNQNVKRPLLKVLDTPTPFEQTKFAPVNSFIDKNNVSEESNDDEDEKEKENCLFPTKTNSIATSYISTPIRRFKNKRSSSKSKRSIRFEEPEKESYFENEERNSKMKSNKRKSREHYSSEENDKFGPNDESSGYEEEEDDDGDEEDDTDSKSDDPYDFVKHPTPSERQKMKNQQRRRGRSSSSSSGGNQGLRANSRSKRDGDTYKRKGKKKKKTYGIMRTIRRIRSLRIVTV